MKIISYRSCLFAIVALLFVASCGGGGTVNLPGSSSSDQLMVLGSNILDGATGVLADSVIQVTFSRDVDPLSLTDETFYLQRGSQNVAGAITYSEADRVATLTPASPLSLITLYTMTVTTGVKDTSGIGLAANQAFSFLTKDLSWGTAMRLGPAASSPLELKIAMSSKGDAVVVWNETLPNLAGIWALYYDIDTKTWGEPTRIDAGIGQVFAPAVTIDPDGNAVAAWLEILGGQHHVFANYYSVADARWLAALQIDNGLNNAASPHVASSSTGRIMAVWPDSVGGIAHIYSNRMTAPGTWGFTPILIENEVTHANGPEIAVDSMGNAAAVWLQSGATWSIWDNQFTSVGWASAGQLALGSGNQPSIPHILVDPFGVYTALWQQDDGFTNNIVAVHTSDLAGIHNPDLLQENVGIDAKPSLAVDGSGNVVVVWFVDDPATQLQKIYASRFDNSAGTWGAPEVIDGMPPPFQAGQEPKVALDPAGNGLAVFMSGTPDILYGRFIGANASWSLGASPLNSISIAGRPQVAMDGSGRAFAIWVQLEGGIVSIWANRFE